MKKFMTDIKTLAALLMAGAAFTACSSDDNIIEQPQNPTEPQVYTMVIKASKGGDTTTRALQPGYDDVLGKNTVDAYWSGDETIEVYQSGEKIGEATAAPSANGNTTITAELTSAPNPSSDLDFYLGGKTPDYTGQVGLLTGTNSISENYDYATDLVYSGAYTVDEINKKITPNEGSLPLTFGAAQQAIIKFTLKDKANDAAISPSALTVTDGTSTVELTSIPAATYTANGGDNNVLYVAFPAAGSAKTITLTATVGDDTYTFEKAGITFTNGQYYEITVKMKKAAASLIVNPVVGQIIGSDGKNYDANATLPTGVTAVAMIAYVGSDAETSTTYNHGLALALSDVSGSQKWCLLNGESCLSNQYATESAAKGDVAGIANTDALVGHGSHTHAAANAARNYKYADGVTEGAHPTGTSAWYLPSAGQWDKMATAAGGYSSLKTNAGLASDYYWSSSELAATGAWNFKADTGKWTADSKTFGDQVRACLAF